MNTPINQPPLTIMLNALHLCQLLGHDRTLTFNLVCKAIHSMLWREYLDTPEFHALSFSRWLESKMPVELAQRVYSHGELERKRHEVTQLHKQSIYSGSVVGPSPSTSNRP